VITLELNSAPIVTLYSLEYFPKQYLSSREDLPTSMERNKKNKSNANLQANKYFQKAYWNRQQVEA